MTVAAAAAPMSMRRERRSDCRRLVSAAATSGSAGGTTTLVTCTIAGLDSDAVLRNGRMNGLGGWSDRQRVRTTRQRVCEGVPAEHGRDAHAQIDRCRLPDAAMPVRACRCVSRSFTFVVGDDAEFASPNRSHWGNCPSSTDTTAHPTRVHRRQPCRQKVPVSHPPAIHPSSCQPPASASPLSSVRSARALRCGPISSASRFHRPSPPQMTLHNTSQRGAHARG